MIEYFRILFDTLIAFEVPAWKESKKRTPIKASKYYLFDVGIQRTLQKQKRLRESTTEYGQALEAFIAHELKSYIDAFFPTENLYYWRTTSQFEVDFIVMDKIGVEVKATSKVVSSDLKGLRALREENKLDAYILVSLDKHPRTEDGILLLPVAEFLERLWRHDPFTKGLR